MNYDLFVKSILDYIENRVAEEITPEDAAQAAGFSVSHFRAVFRDTTGETLSRYITYRRLCHAASELMRTGRPIVDIAMTYGFGSHDVFIRAFKRMFGETPSNFRMNRRKMSSTLIVPGVFGPTVFGMEERRMRLDNRNFEEMDAGTLYGVVPRVSYFNQEIELTPFIACLKACLAYMGQEVSYARLLCGSGTAFRLMWNPKYWDGGNVDILCMSKDPTEPLRRAFKAAGREYDLLSKPGKAGHNMVESAPEGIPRIKTGMKEEFLELVKGEIDSGRPLIGFGIIGPPEACIIAGYREGGETLIGWNFFQEMPEFASVVGKEPCGYFNRKGWYEHPETIALMAIGEEVPMTDEREFLKDVLGYALKTMETERVNDHAGGFAAYEAWAEALSRESEFPKDAQLPMLLERQMCHGDAMTMVGEGRWYAQLFLEQEADKFPELQGDLKAASQLFRQEHKVVTDMGLLIGGMGMGEKQARNLARPEVRREIVGMIRQCAQWDKEASEHIKKAVSLL
ncbi:MAG: helix-turn-helix transcriptional regulator [Clostridia bacterium]|nr:helix-turn-helix transcriptional regulator [Clostridia bacterium]